MTKTKELKSKANGQSPPPPPYEKVIELPEMIQGRLKALAKERQQAILQAQMTQGKIDNLIEGFVEGKGIEDVRDMQLDQHFKCLLINKNQEK